MPSEGGEPASVSEVVGALKKVGFETKLENPNWGCWIHLSGYQTSISVDLERRLISRACLEIDDADPDEVQSKLFAAFAKLGWQGEDEDGPFRLD